MDFKRVLSKKATNAHSIDSSETGQEGRDSSTMHSSAAYEAPGIWHSPSDFNEANSKQEGRPRIQFKSHKLTISSSSPSMDASPSRKSRNGRGTDSPNEPQFKKLTTKEFVMHVSTQMLRRSLDRVESILPQKHIPERSVTHLLPQAITQDIEGQKRLNLRILDNLQMKQVGTEDPAILGGSLRRERDTMSPDTNRRRQQHRRPHHRGSNEEGAREISTAPAAMRGAGSMVHRSALGGDSLTSRPGGGGGGGGLASRMQSRLQSRFQMSGQSFLSPSKQQQQQQEVGIVSQLETKRSSSGLLSHLNFLDHEGDFGSEEDGEEGGGKGVERVKSEAAANTRPSSSFPDKNNSMGSGNGGNILYQTMFMSLPKIESPKTSKGFLHKMRKPGKKKETTLAAEASLVDRGQFFDHTALEFEPAEDQMSELGSEATEIIFPPSIVLGGNRPASRFNRPHTTDSSYSSAPLLTPESDLYYMASHMGIITGDRTSYEDDHQSPTAYPRSPGVIAASFTVTGGRQTTATTNAATSAEGQRAKSPQKGTSSGPPSPAYGAKAPKAGAQGPVSPPLSLLKHQAALAAHAAGQAHGDGGGGGGKSVALKSYGSRSIKGEGGGGGGADLARNKSIKTVHHAMDQSLSAQEGGGKTGAGGSSRPGSSSSRPLSGRERVSQAIEKVSSTINLGLKFNPELNMTQKTREQTREYAASVTQVMTQGVSLKLLQKIVDMIPDQNMSTGEMVQTIVMRETRHLKCRYVDTLANPEQMIGPPQFYISHSWRCCFVDLVDAIVQFVSTRVPKMELDTTYVWMDCFCINQHPPDGRFIPQFVDLTAMREIIASCEKTLLILDKEGSSLLQTGCLWDIWLTSNLDKMDKGRLIPLSVHWDWEALEPSFDLMDVLSSVGGQKVWGKVWGAEPLGRERDRKAMLADMIRSATGAYSGDSVTVTGDLKDMVLNGAKRELQRATNYANVIPRWPILAANATAMILFLRRQYSDAEEILRQALRIIEKANAKSVPDVEVVSTKLHQAYNCMAKGSMNEAENICQDVLAKFDQLKGHELYMAVMAALGCAMCSNGNFTRGERMIQKALIDIENNMGTRHPFYSSNVLMLSSLAASQRLCKQAGEGALDVLELCVRKYPDLQGTDEGPALGHLLQYLRGGGVGLIPKQVYKMFMPSAKAQASFAMIKSHAVKPIQTVLPKDDPGRETHETFVKVEILSAGEDVAGREHETVLLEVAAALHVLAFSQSSSNRLDAAHQLVCHSVYLRQRLLPESHPLTLESLLLQAQILIKLDQAHEAVKIMVDASGKMTRVLGPDHVDTLLCMGELADLYRSIGQTQEASLVERKIIEAGSSLLLHTKVLDRVRNVAVVCSLLASREHLLEKASLVMAKVLIVYREKLGNEHKLTRLTRNQLSEILERVKVLGSKALQDAFSGISMDENYKVAEVMYRQALVVEQLIDPDSDQSILMEGLVEAQFGQGKTHEAQKTMRAWRMMPQQVAKGKDALPTSYLRWLNKDKGDLATEAQDTK